METHQFDVYGMETHWFHVCGIGVVLCWCFRIDVEGNGWISRFCVFECVWSGIKGFHRVSDTLYMILFECMMDWINRMVVQRE